MGIHMVTLLHTITTATITATTMIPIITMTTTHTTTTSPQLIPTGTPIMTR